MVCFYCCFCFLAHVVALFLRRFFAFLFFLPSTVSLDSSFFSFSCFSPSPPPVSSFFSFFFSSYAFFSFFFFFFRKKIARISQRFEDTHRSWDSSDTSMSGLWSTAAVVSNTKGESDQTWNLRPYPIFYITSKADIFTGSECMDFGIWWMLLVMLKENRIRREIYIRIHYFTPLQKRTIFFTGK